MTGSGAQFDQGPYLSAALLCEKLLIDNDGVASAIRIIDRVTRTAVGASPPEQMEPFDYHLTFVVTLKAGWAHGSYPLRIALVSPQAGSRDILKQTVFFEGGEDRGVNVVGQMTVRFEAEGIYWFELFLGEKKEEKLLTRIPLRVIYLRTFTPPPRGESELSSQPQEPQPG
jgi:hypothetical protein